MLSIWRIMKISMEIHRSNSHCANSRSNKDQALFKFRSTCCSKRCFKEDCEYFWSAMSPLIIVKRKHGHTRGKINESYGDSCNGNHNITSTEFKAHRTNSLTCANSN